MIGIEGVSAKRGTFSLDDISLTVGDGEYLTILGPTASGKTMLLRAIVGLLPIDSGRLMVDGTDVAGLPPEARHMGYVPQEHVLFPFLDVSGNIAFGLRNHHEGIGASDVRKKVKKVADLVGITHLLDRDVCSLSGGEKQRVSLARAIVTEPSLLLLDEPMSSLDHQTKEVLWRTIRRIHRKLDIPIIHVTHDFEEAYLLSDRIGILDGGRIVHVGGRDETFYRPEDSRVASFVGIKNVYPCTVRSVSKKDGTVFEWRDREFVGAASKVGPGIEACFCIHPTQVMIIPPDRETEPRENTLKGSIVDEFFRGPTVTLFYRIEASENEHDLEIDISDFTYHRFDLDRVKDVDIYLRKEAIHIFRDGNGGKDDRYLSR